MKKRNVKWDLSARSAFRQLRRNEQASIEKFVHAIEVGNWPDKSVAKVPGADKTYVFKASPDLRMFVDRGDSGITVLDISRASQIRGYFKK